MELVLLDSNVVIYAAQAQYRQLAQYLQGFNLGVSKVTQVEVLGYHLLSQADRALFETFFTHITAFDLTESVIRQAIGLKQQKNMSLGDSLIAATALVYAVPLFTHNVKDFAHIPALSIQDPLVASGYK